MNSKTTNANPGLERLRAYATGRRSGVTGADLAEASGLNARVLSEARTGRRNLTAAEAEQVSEATDALDLPVFAGVTALDVLGVFGLRSDKFRRLAEAEASPEAAPE